MANSAAHARFGPDDRAFGRGAPVEAVDLIGAVARYRRDQEVFGQGAPADHVYKVLHGSVRGFNLLADGRRQITDFYLPGDIFGLESGPEHRGAAEAVSDCALVSARRSSLKDQVCASWWLWELAVRDLERGQSHMLTLGRRSAAERLARFLIDIADRLGGGEVVELPMSRQDIADYLGVTIETVSRTLTQLTARGLIDVRACRAIRLCDRGALTAMCE